MKVTFKNHMEIAALQNSFLFAEHSPSKIARVSELDPARGEQCKRENEAWITAQKVLRDAKPDVEIEITLE